MNIDKYFNNLPKAIKEVYVVFRSKLPSSQLILKYYLPF